jgi:hypothetical protein
VAVEQSSSSINFFFLTYASRPQTPFNPLRPSRALLGLSPLVSGNQGSLMHCTKLLVQQLHFQETYTHHLLIYTSFLLLKFPSKYPPDQMIRVSCIYHYYDKSERKGQLLPMCKRRQCMHNRWRSPLAFIKKLEIKARKNENKQQKWILFEWYTDTMNQKCMAEESHRYQIPWIKHVWQKKVIDTGCHVLRKFIERQIKQLILIFFFPCSTENIVATKIDWKTTKFMY